MSALLKLYWDPQREDNFVIATADGERDALNSGYFFIRGEGYLFPSSEPGTVPLKLFWDPARGDNFTTATADGEQSALAAGYQFVRVEGYVHPNPQPNLIPLKLFWSTLRGDNFTTATADGERAALAAGYRFVRVEGYISPLPTLRSGKYQVAINGFTCLTLTRDDYLHHDGNWDEVYFKVNRRVVRGKDGVAAIPPTDVVSRKMGDIQGHPGRVKAGSGSSIWYGPTGGIMQNDSYPTSTPWLQNTNPAGRDFPPYVIWEGELTEGSPDVVFLTPTIWEEDNVSDILDVLTNWADWQIRVDAAYGQRAKEVFGKIWPVAMPVFDAVSLGIQTFATLNKNIFDPLCPPFSRPIGLQKNQSNPTGPPLFNPMILALTYDTAEYLVNDNPTGRGQGIIGWIYQDDPFLRGEYQIWLQIKRV